MDSVILISIGIVAGAILGVAVLKMLKKDFDPESQLAKILPEIENRFNRLSREALRNNSEEFSKRFQELAKEKLGRASEAVKSDRGQKLGFGNGRHEYCHPAR
ncbi:MAG: hypothetical protein V1732_01860 [Patescibacteria group bacterium]